jgi:tRNA pseudouridine55 synthase
MNGIVLIDKPVGFTSHDVVARVRRILREKRVGHTGTLDPFATGLLVVLIGPSTRLMQFISSSDKEYEAVIRFGFATDTGDRTGRLLVRPDASGNDKRPDRLSLEEIDSVIASLHGEIDQVPPMYSAKKFHGRKLYEYARRGEEVERKPARVTIREFERIEAANKLSVNPYGTLDLSVRVVCSGGTYIRSLGELIGERVGVPAHLQELRRTRAGVYAIDDARNLDDLEEAVRASSIDEVVLPPDSALRDRPFMHLSADEVRRAAYGLDVTPPASTGWSQDDLVRMLDSAGNLIAVGRFNSEQGTLHPKVVLAAEN